MSTVQSNYPADPHRSQGNAVCTGGDDVNELR